MATSTVADSTGDAPPPIIPEQPLQHGTGEEDDGETCRICRYPGSTEDPLRYPCACRGSIRYVHEQCLLQWLNRRKLKSCERRQELSDDLEIRASTHLEMIRRVQCARDQIPMFLCSVASGMSNLQAYILFHPNLCGEHSCQTIFCELVFLAFAKTISFLQLFIRFCFVMFSWIFVLPFIIFRIWLFTLARSLSDSTKLFSGHLFTPVKIFTESLLGILLILGIAVVAVVVTHLFEYLIHVVNRGPDGHEMVNHNGRQRMNWPFGARGNNHGAHDIGGENGGQQMDRHDAAHLAAWVGNQSFEKFVGMEGPIHDLLKNWMLVLATILALVGFLSFVPFSLGRMVFYCLRFSLSSLLQYKQSTASLTNHASYTEFAEQPNLLDLTTIVVGYTSVIAPIVIYICFKNAKTIFGRMTRLFPSFGALFLDCVRDLIINLKVPFIILVELVVFPIVFGWWIDVCSLELVGCSIDSRLRFFLAFPNISICVHLFLGLVYIFLLNSFIEDVQEVLNNRIVDFHFTMLLQGPEPIHMIQDKPASDHALQLLLLFSIYGGSIVMAIYIPVQLIMKLDFASSIFPLNFEVAAAHAHALLFLVCMPTVFMNFKYPRGTIRAVLGHWFAVVGHALNLTNTLLPTDFANIVHGNRNDSLATQDPEPDLHGSLDAAGVHEPDDRADHKYSFLFRVTLLLVLAWISLLLFSTAMIVLPAFIGRVVFDAIHHSSILDAILKCDLFALIVGRYIFWRWIVIARSLMSYLGNWDAFSLESKTWKWCTTDLKNMLFYSIWICAAPLLVGLLLDALFLPLTANVNVSRLVPELQLHWAYGGILLRFIAVYAFGLLNDENSFLMNVARMELYWGHWGHFRGISALTEVIIPVLSLLLTALCLPHVIANLILPLMGLPHLHHYAWVGFLAMSVVARIFIRTIPFGIKKLHDYIKDDRYLIERRMDNYGERIHAT